MPDASPADNLGYAVSLLDGAERIASTAINAHIGTIAISFHLLVGFSIENGLKALLRHKEHPGPWQRSHDLEWLYDEGSKVGLGLSPEMVAMVRRLSRYHKEFWFRYPERASVADVYPAGSTLFMTEALLRQIFRLTETAIQLFDERDRTNPDTKDGPGP